MQEAIITGEASIYVTIALIIGGIIIAFIGKTLLKYIMMIVSGGVISVAMYILLTRWLDVGTSQAIIISVIAFLVGAFLGWFIVKAAISVVIGLILGVVAGVALGLEENIAALIVIIIVSMGLSYVLAEKVIDFALTLLGSILVFFGIYSYWPTITGKEIGGVLALIVFIAATYYKVKKKKEKE
ncbi:hypothetical protein J4526_00905 [Desulfurococcaceae archaeon MEX13E-LK6-19]|nr:hypothetical protein J4526_00905 [Desulfurococcaceae archaeon MEX13E-LK6-19]